VVGDFDSHAVGSRNDKIDFGTELDGLPIVQNLFGRESITVKSDRWRGCLASDCLLATKEGMSLYYALGRFEAIPTRIYDQICSSPM